MARSTEEIFGNSSNDETTDPVRDAQEPAAAAPVVEEPFKEPKTEQEPVVKASEKDDDEPQEHTPDDLDGLKKALAASRGDKRKARKQWQETERKLAELQGQLSVYKQRTEQPTTQTMPSNNEPAIPELDDLNLFDPAAVKKYVQHVAEQIADQRVEKRPRWWYDQDKAATKERHPDFDENFNEFKKAADLNPALWAQAETASSPGEFICKTGKTLREMQGVESLDDLREKIRTEERAKIESELGIKQATHQAQAPAAPVRPKIPTSLASIPGRGLGTSPSWKGPRSTEEIFGNR